MNKVEYHISDELREAHKNFRKVYEAEVLKLCREMHPNFDITGAWDRINIMDEAEKMIREEFWK